MKRDRGFRDLRGFTLIEALVSILILSVVMIVALTLLVSMRSFAAKQQAFTAPRQSARAAIDYLSFFLASATDLNVEAVRPALAPFVEVGNPNALVMLTTFGTAGTPRQASFNNLTEDQGMGTGKLGYGDEGTDIISLSIPTNPVRIPIMADSTWTGKTAAGNQALLNFSAGCGPGLTNNDVENLRLFKEATGATVVGASEVSGLLTVQDSVGRWRYLQISRYVSSNCAAMNGTDPSREVISIEFLPGTTDQINPPGGWRGADFVEPFTLNAGVEYTSFRVRNRTLEQKTTGRDADGVLSPGFFNPACDGNNHAGCPTIGFTPVVENVEDLQIAYVLRDGTIWNSLTNPAAKPGAIPEQVATLSVAPGPSDVTLVRALRVSVIARSNPLDIGVRGLSASLASGLYRRRALEDHPEGLPDTVATGVFDRYRLTTTLVLRNRMLGF